MEKILMEIERIEKDSDLDLDRKCIGLYNTAVVFMDTAEICNLTECDYFAKKGSLFDPFWGGCHITPGEITTLRKIHKHALMCEAKSRLVRDYYEYRYDRIGIPIDKEQYYRMFVPELLNNNH